MLQAAYRRFTALGLAFCIVGPGYACAWQVTLRSDDTQDRAARAVVALPDGDVVVGGLQDGDRWLALRLDGRSGAEVWRRERVAQSSGGVAVVELMNDGDVVVGGGEFDGTADAVVERLDAASGASLWEFIATGLWGVSALAVHSSDAVYVGAGSFPGAAIKLDGATGGLLWQQAVTSVVSMAAHPSGDVVVIVPTGGLTEPEAQRLSGVDGSILWQTAVSYPTQIVIDASGDVIVGGGLTDEVTKLDGVTGAVEWSVPELDNAAVAVDPGGDVFAAHLFAFRRLSGASGAVLFDVPLAGVVVAKLAVAPSGQVAFAGYTDPAPAFAIGQLEAATGALRWMHAFEGSGGGGEALDLAVLDDDSVAAAGSVDEQVGVLQNARFTAALASDRLGGRKLTTKDPAGEASLRKLTALSTDGALLVGPPVSGNDPTVVGGALTLVDTATLATQTVTLPAQNWSVRPNDGRTRYVYKDSDLSEGPCKVATLANGKKLKVRCLGAGITFPLDAAAAAGTFGMRLEIGTSRACIVFGGNGIDKGSGVFVRTDAPAPAECP